MYGLTAKEKLAQNFLLDLNLTDKMARAAGDLTGATVIEVGAGPGGLTRSLLRCGAAKVIAVEKDKRFIPALELLQAASGGRLKIVLADMMEVDEEKLLEGTDKIDWAETAKVKIIGNLPFNVGTHLMLKWLRMIPDKKGPFVYGRVPMTLMFQKELAERLVAPVGGWQYGRLSVMVGQTCNAYQSFTIPGKAFVPPPEVDAAVIYLEPKINPSVYGIVPSCGRIFFSLRRKMLSNSAKLLGGDGLRLLEKANIDPTLRPQNVPIDDWCRLGVTFQEWIKHDIAMRAHFNKNALHKEVEYFMTEDEIAAKRAHRQEKKEKFKEFTEKAKVDREKRAAEMDKENTGSNNTNKATFLGEQNTQLDKLKAVEDFERLKAKKFPTR